MESKPDLEETCAIGFPVEGGSPQICQGRIEHPKYASDLP